jgi:hypothetical protein
MEQSPSLEANSFSVNEGNPYFYEIQWFIAVFTKARNLSVSCVRIIQSTLPHSVSLNAL